MLSISSEFSLGWVPPDFNNDESTLVQVMLWYPQDEGTKALPELSGTTRHYLSQCWPSSLSPHSITRPQWVNTGKTIPYYRVTLRPETKWPPFFRWHFQINFLKQKCFHFDSNFTDILRDLQTISQRWITYCQAPNRQQTIVSTVIVYFTGTYMHHLALMSDELSHFHLVPHICVWVSISSGNGLSPLRRQAITKTNAGLLSIGLLGTSFSEIELEFYHLHSWKCIWKCRLPKWRPFCSGGDELIDDKALSGTNDGQIGWLLKVSQRRMNLIKLTINQNQ